MYKYNIDRLISFIIKLIIIYCCISMQRFSVMRLSSENYVNRETHVVICYLVAKELEVFIEMLCIK